MSSRLFQEIRENRGLVYAICSYSASYHESGLFAVYGGTSVENMEEVLNLVKSEFSKILHENITPDELSHAKNQIRAALVLGQESMSNRMIRLAKSQIYFRRIIPLEEIINDVLKVTHDDIARVATQIFGDYSYPIAAIGPFRNRKIAVS